MGALGRFFNGLLAPDAGSWAICFVLAARASSCEGRSARAAVSSSQNSTFAAAVGEAVILSALPGTGFVLPSDMPASLESRKKLGSAMRRPGNRGMLPLSGSSAGKAGCSATFSLDGSAERGRFHRLLVGEAETLCLAGSGSWTSCFWQVCWLGASISENNSCALWSRTYWLSAETHRRLEPLPLAVVGETSE